jgi:1-acyl-sn-glycerol-3-phosphate acyltransferase
MLYRALEIGLAPLLRGYFDVQVTGQAMVPRSGAAIIAANHVSASDEVFTPLAAGRQILYFAKAEYFNGTSLRGRLNGAVFRALGQIPVERDDPRAAASTVDIGVEALANGNLLGIYPEGTRSPDGQLHKFRTGVARLALRSGAPVIPVGLVGTDLVLPPGGKAWRRRPVSVHFGAPLDFSGRSEDERSAKVLRDVTDTIRIAIQELSGQTYVDAYGSAVKAL